MALVGTFQGEESCCATCVVDPLALCCHLSSCSHRPVSRPPLPALPGTWVHPFDQGSTRDENFYVNETTLVQVPMMFQSSEIKYLRDQLLPCQLVQLDYVGNSTVFFILPNAGEIDTVVAALSRDTIQRWSSSLTIR